MAAEYIEWLKRGGDDLKSLEILIKYPEGPPSTGCFLAQQATEKFLKALQIVTDLDPERTHDLIELATTLAKFYPEIKEFYEDFLSLNQYYIETRYPGDYPEFTWDECQKAYDVALKIKVFVLSKIG